MSVRYHRHWDLNVRKKGTGEKRLLTIDVRRLIPLSVLLLFLVASSDSGHAQTRQQSAEAGKKAYSFGVFPFLPAVRLEAVFAPISGELGRALGRDIHYRSAATYELFASRLAKQEFDIAHIQPFDYVQIAAKKGYLPVARRNDVLAAIAVVREDSPVRGMNDLRGAIIAMPTEVAATTTLAKVMLKQADIDPGKDVKIKYFEDHHSCIHQMMIGSAAACFTGIQSARLYEAKTGARLRTIARSASIPQTLFVVHSRVPRRDRETIRKTLLTSTLQGLAPELREFISRDAQQPFIPATDGDYDIVRQYGNLLEESQ